MALPQLVLNLVLAVVGYLIALLATKWLGRVGGQAGEVDWMLVVGAGLPVLMLGWPIQRLLRLYPPLPSCIVAGCGGREFSSYAGDLGHGQVLLLECYRCHSVIFIRAESGDGLVLDGNLSPTAFLKLRWPKNLGWWSELPLQAATWSLESYGVRADHVRELLGRGGLPGASEEHSRR